MIKLYKSECMLALLAFALAALLTHIYPIYFLFPELTQMEMFGFPAHYFLTLFLGWVVMMPLYWIYMVVSEKIDMEIQETASDSVEGEAPKSADGEARLAPGGAK